MTDFDEPTTTYWGVLKDWKEWYVSLVQGWQIWLIVGLMQALALVADAAIPDVQSRWTLIHVALFVYSAYKIRENWGAAK